jgi:pilus assembly protein Flp/PilA
MLGEGRRWKASVRFARGPLWYASPRNLPPGACPRPGTLKERRKSMLYAAKERGQGLVEYALILVLVAVVVIVILALLGPAIGNVFSNIVNQI